MERVSTCVTAGLQIKEVSLPDYFSARALIKQAFCSQLCAFLFRPICLLFLAESRTHIPVNRSLCFILLIFNCQTATRTINWEDWNCARPLFQPIKRLIIGRSFDWQSERVLHFMALCPACSLMPKRHTQILTQQPKFSIWPRLVSLNFHLKWNWDTSSSIEQQLRIAPSDRAATFELLMFYSSAVLLHHLHQCKK